MKLAPLLIGTALAVSCCCSALADDPFQAHVRPTDPLSPAEQQKSFQLPPGFEIQLVASEPEIQKPLNMAFDARGRLWITDTVEYPYPAPPDQPGRDSIKILEDTDGDGRADQVTTFADGLNIPIGLYPYKNGVIAYSIPNIYFFEDTDGDDRADRRTKLFGPFDYSRDTHGMQNAFRRGLDGWLYACHGFNNQSTVSGADGHTIAMHSGNTYRMRLDGSRIEHYTWGQVNPFGMTQDPLGNLFTADCHSKPIYQLIRGGYYPSFGRPHDGLGFVPPMMDHLHGSTAIAGVAFYADDRFPPEYRGDMFSGNVMTSRVNRNSLVYHGSTIKAKEEPDFVTTDDPWFRPVDVQLAPDGSLYIADFYNRIIGHYEVPLDHPGRDRHRGRIWRVVYKGDGVETRPRPPVNLASAGVEELVAALASPNLTQRLLATDELTDRIGVEAAPALNKALAESDDPYVRAHALWALFRLDALDGEELAKASADPDRLVRVHAMKTLAETPKISDHQRALATAALGDSDAFVQRAAAEALGQHPNFASVRPLLELIDAAPTEDVLLRHMARIALRNQFRDGDVAERLAELELSEAQRHQVAEVLVAVPSPEAAAYLIEYIQQDALESDQLRRYVEHAARHIEPDRIDTLAAVAREKFAVDLDLQQSLLRSLRDGLAQRGAAPPPSLRQWAVELATRLLDSTAGEASDWTNTPLPGAPRQENPWVLQQRPSADGDTQSRFLCSLPLGEQLTGVLRSPTFTIPEKLSFYTAGHVGPPGQPVVAKNFIRLRDAATGAVLAESTPPRNDTAQRVEWDLRSHGGREGYIEIVDGDQRGAYAWLAVGRFQPEVVSLPQFDPAAIAQRRQTAAKLIAELRLEELTPRLVEMLRETELDHATQKAAVEAILALRPDPLLAALTPVLDDAGSSRALRSAVLQTVANPESAARRELLAEVFRQTPQRVQAAVAQSLVSTPQGAETLVAIVEQGLASPRLLILASVESALAGHNIDGLQDRVRRLTQSLPPANETLRRLIEQRKERHQNFAASVEHGAQVFEKHCAACHQVGGKGSIIGPQLDGIGNRGLERVLEDVLAPNQNVDVAFRTTTFALADGRVVSGLVRREEGEVLVVADQKGQEMKIAKSDIEEQAQTPLSLMPENVAEIVPEDDFHHLIGFLLSQRGQPPTQTGN